MKTAIRAVILTVATAWLTWAQVSDLRQAGRRPASTPSQRVIPIKARRFEFTPSTVTLKKGEPVVLRLTSDDVTHGFFVRPLNIDAEIHPGSTTEVEVTPQTAGTYTIICDHFCGVNHGNMRMTIEVVE